MAGHRADYLIAKGSWTVLSVRRLMTGIGLLGPAVFVLLFGSVSSVAVAIRWELFEVQVWEYAHVKILFGFWKRRTLVNQISYEWNNYGLRIGSIIRNGDWHSCHMHEEHYIALEALNLQKVTHSGCTVVVSWCFVSTFQQAFICCYTIGASVTGSVME